MTRKQLPKAILHAPHGRRAAAPAPTDAAAPAPRAFAALETTEAEPEPRISREPAANDVLPPAEPLDGSYAIKRRAAAKAIVERHKAYAVMSGLAPLPLVNIASVTAINMRMVKRLADLYGLPFQRERTRSTIVGLIGGAAPTGIGAAAASTLGFVIPGGALVGLAVSAVTAGALTRAIGLVFVESFENGAMPVAAV